VGVAIDSIADMRRLFDSLLRDRRSQPFLQAPLNDPFCLCLPPSPLLPPARGKEREIEALVEIAGDDRRPSRQ
jgi:hypothetical protein